jgi:hypothetical protein
MRGLEDVFTLLNLAKFSAADESRRLHEANADSSTYFQSDAEATNEMIRLNDILSDYKMEVQN